MAVCCLAKHIFLPLHIWLEIELKALLNVTVLVLLLVEVEVVAPASKRNCWSRELRGCVHFVPFFYDISLLVKWDRARFFFHFHSTCFNFGSYLGFGLLLLLCVVLFALAMQWHWSAGLSLVVGCHVYWNFFFLYIMICWDMMYNIHKNHIEINTQTQTRT